jgi:hypothetical protein
MRKTLAAVVVLSVLSVSRHSSKSDHHLATTLRAPRTFHLTMDASADISRTRSKNKHQHPGAVEVAAKRKRRTKSEIAADNAAREERKQEKGRKVNEQVNSIASLEVAMAKKDANAEGAHPRSRNGDVYIFVPLS